ncbi:D-amino acid aminotransferase [Aureimonas endophytica]|uniref:Probable branched-chain-amino-acid aminotransferase n=1 Tax=Aureimonas endophytica TaxID=2027858 RepID=A0A916ZZY5_9HYPH|nr:D-amino-acid transaminase [Aureimonas endophytica]GGE18634.1 D-amino acid aminotransferase [Aureimonas endophytica]
MQRITYVNGDYLPESEAKVSIFDRGFLMADGVYEVTTVIGGKLIDFPGHMARLKRSLGELAMAAPAGEEEILAIHRELVRRNELDEGLVYLQVTRGAADRDFAFPPEGTAPSLVLFTQKLAVLERETVRRGLKVASVPDLRWARRDIKTVQLLYPTLAKMEAKAKGADDAWMVDDEGLVTEGSSNNAYIVAGGKVVTRPLSHSILHGITRGAVLALTASTGIELEERPFSLAEAKAAEEAFITSASAFVTPVVSIDGVPLGTGAPGPVAARLRELYIAESLKRAI